MNPEIAARIEQFFAQYRIHHYAKGQVLIQAQSSPEYIYQLLDGRVKQYDISFRGDEVILNIFKPPAFFPMSYAINQTPNSYFFEAETDASARLAPIPDVISFIKSEPDVLYDLLARVYRGTDGLLGRLAHLMAGTARSRILYELLLQCRRFGEARDDGMAIGLTETDIAARAGLARETVSREIRKLRTDGLISANKNELLIADPDRLAALVSCEL